MNCLAIALDVDVHCSRSHVDDPLLSSRTVLGLLDELLVLEVDLQFTSSYVLLMVVDLLVQLYFPIFHIDILIPKSSAPGFLSELFVEHLPEGNLAFADVIGCVFFFVEGPNDDLDEVVGDVVGTHVESQGGHGV